MLFLVHGSSPAALSSFDLTVPGHGEYSLMNAFARDGFDVWTMDHEGYGRSDRTDANSDIASGVQDLIAAAAVVQRETGQARMHMLGESSGALRAGAYAMAQPDRLRRLVLEAFTYTGEGSPTLGKRGQQAEFYRTHPAARATRPCCSASSPATTPAPPTRPPPRPSPRRRCRSATACPPAPTWT